MPKDVSITDLIAKAKANLENVARSMPSGKLPTTDDRVALISQLVTALEFVTVPTENEREAWESYTSTVSDFFAETPEIREAFMAGFRLPVPVERNEFNAQVLAERQRQFAKGYDRAHDDKYGVDHLLMWAQEYARVGAAVKSAALLEAARECLLRKRLAVPVEPETPERFPDPSIRKEQKK